MGYFRIGQKDLRWEKKIIPVQEWKEAVKESHLQMIKEGMTLDDVVCRFSLTDNEKIRLHIQEILRELFS